MQRKGFLLLALICGFIAAGSAYMFLINTPTSPEIEMKPLVVTQGNIPARTVIKAEQLTTVEIPSQGYPLGGATSLDNVVGSVALVNLKTGEAIVSSMIQQSPNGENRNSYSASSSLSVPAGKRAVAIPINLVSGVGYNVLPGDYVDVLVTMDIENSLEKLVPTTSLAAQDVQVLSVGGSTIEDEENSKNLSKSYTLALSVPQAMAVTLGSEKGSIRLLLRNPANTDIQTQTPFTPAQFLDPDYFSRIK